MGYTSSFVLGFIFFALAPIVKFFIPLVAIKFSHGQTVFVFVIVHDHHGFSIAQYTGTRFFCSPDNGFYLLPS